MKKKKDAGGIEFFPLKMFGQKIQMIKHTHENKKIPEFVSAITKTHSITFEIMPDGFICNAVVRKNEAML